MRTALFILGGIAAVYLVGAAVVWAVVSLLDPPGGDRGE